LSSVPLPHEAPEPRPFLLPRRPVSPTVSSRSPLAFWHLLSLDAPTVAAVWTAFIAWSAGVRIGWLDPVAMFLAVWMLYAADRLLDAKPLFNNPSAAHLEERHHFHHRHRARFLPLVLLAFVPLLVLLHRTQEAVLHLYVLLAGMLGAWLLLIHVRPAPSEQQHRLPKELAVGVFFPAAVFIATVARAPQLRLALVLPALCFAAVCSLNCLFLYAWEHPRNRRDAHATTRWAVRHLKALALAFTLLADALYFAVANFPGTHALHWMTRIPHPAAIPLACATASALLLVLHASRRSLSPLNLRALADLALLTPVLVVIVSTLRHR
jgi:hypothetical protein